MDKSTMIPDTVSSPAEGYTLYPDAGDFTGLPDSVPLPDTTRPIPAPSPQSAPTIVFTPPRPAVPTEPQNPPPVPPAAVRPTVHKHHTFPRFLFRTLLFLLSLFAAAVYTKLLLSSGNTLLSEGIGKLAADAVFGSTGTAVILPESESMTAEIAPPVLTAPESQSPPASELPAPVPVTDVLSRDLSSHAPDGLGLINETPYTPDLAELAAQPPVIDSYAALESIYGKNCPAVLILHTHGTEAFQDQADAGYHTDNTARNILSVGEALEKTLTDAGIVTIRCTDLFDAESFDMAYYNAARYIRKTLAEYPSIRYILDIHRDAITTPEGTGIRPIAAEGDTEYAQMMFVVGTDHGGSGHTGWETNLALAARLQSAIHREHPTLMRDINLRSASFNAQYAPGALLIEAGAACSSLEEALRSIRILGEALAEEILGP